MVTTVDQLLFESNSTVIDSSMLSASPYTIITIGVPQREMDPSLSALSAKVSETRAGRVNYRSPASTKRMMSAIV